MNLSLHFRRQEFQKAEPMPESIVPAYLALCRELLEPVRTRFGSPIRITSGYRSPARNAAIGGSPKSQHVAGPDFCAADFQIPGVSLVEIFDWIRLQSGLLFDQLILEYGPAAEMDTDDCIHISWARQPRRMALVGATKNRAPYVQVEVRSA